MAETRPNIVIILSDDQGYADVGYHGHIYDGKNLLPILQNETVDSIHQNLFFDGDDGYWSVRSGDWKLVSNKEGELELDFCSKKMEDLEFFALKSRPNRSQNKLPLTLREISIAPKR